MRYEDKTKEELLEELRAIQERLARAEDRLRQAERALSDKGGASPEAAETMGDGPASVIDHDCHQGRLRLAVERLPMAYILCDADSRVIEWNPAAENVFGYTREEVLGRVLGDLILPAPVPAPVREIICRVHAGDMDAHSVNENRTRDGRIITCAWFNTPLRDPEGRFAGFISVAQDISEQKRAEEQRRRSEAILAEAEHLASLGSWEWYVPGNAVRWSEELSRIFGLEPGGFGGTYEAFLKQVHPEDRATVTAINGRALQDCSPFEYTYRIVRPDGELRTVYARGQVTADGTGKAIRLIGTCQDVTERRRIEEALEESRQRFQAIFENARDAILLVDDTGRYVDGNPAACEQLGYGREELRQLTVWDVTPVQDRDSIPRLLGQFLAEGTLSGEYTMLRKDGTTREVEFRSVANILPGLHMAIHRDVTERNRTGETVRRLAAIVESSDDAIISKTLDGIITSWNRGAERLYGYTAEEMVGRSVYLLVPSNRIDEEARLLGEIQQGRAVEHYETIRKTREGRFLDVSLSLSPIRNRAGTITGASSIGRDITERRRMEEQLRESADLFQQLGASIAGYFWVNAPDDSAMYYMSPGYEEITGRSCASLYEHPESWADAIHPEDRERILAETCSPCRDQALQLEYRIVRPDGSIRWVRDRAFPVRNASDTVFRIAGIGEDITDRKQAEEKLRQYHDRVQILSRRLLTVQEEERRRLARDLHDGVMQTMISLRLFLEPGPRWSVDNIQARLQDVRSVLDDLVATLRTLATDLRPLMLDQLGLLPALLWLFDRFTAQTMVLVHFRHEGMGGRYPAATETAAYRLIQESLANVARHARVSEVSVRVWVEGNWLHLQVEDEGAGFDPEAALASGAAAGLTGMSERVQLLGGKWIIHSAPGEGTNLMAELPLGG